MKRVIVLCIAFLSCLSAASVAQERRESVGEGIERYDSAAVAQIINEGMQHSKVMDILSWLTDVCGPRLTGSPGYFKALEWARKTMEGWGLANAHLEGWGPWGRGWILKRYEANVAAPAPFPLLSFPKAWSPGTDGAAKGEAIYLNANTDSALATFKGRLKGKFVLLDDPRELAPHFTPDAIRDADSTLLTLANANASLPRQRRARQFQLQSFMQRARMAFKKETMCMEEGALGLLSISRGGDDGTIFVQAASVPTPPDTPFARRMQPYDPKAPETLPQVVVGAEDYNRMIRVLEKGVPVKIEMNLEVGFSKVDSVYNVVAELPGTDLKDEVVMMGGHIDSWHAGTGGTDDGAGVAACMEAMRILKSLGLKPRRTIRVGLWGGEEQGLLGSRAYVRQHFGEPETQASFAAAPAMDRPPKITLKPEAEKFSCYFNDDNGTGKFRGIYLQGDLAAERVFRSWLEPFRSMGASTITALSTGGTDHLSFTAIGLPGFQFIQDEMDYDTRTHHSNMDVYDRVQEPDMKLDAVILAAFAYNAAMADEKMPRK